MNAKQIQELEARGLVQIEMLALAGVHHGYPPVHDPKGKGETAIVAAAEARRLFDLGVARPLSKAAEPGERDALRGTVQAGETAQQRLAALDAIDVGAARYAAVHGGR